MTIDHALSNFQIDRYYKDEPRYGGCYSKDQLVNRSPDNKFWVVNLQSSTDGDGTHWLLVSDLDPSCCLYVDPYGIAPPPAIAEFMRKSKAPKLIYNTDDFQEFTSTECGYYVIFCANNILQGKPFGFGLDTHPDAHNERTVL